MTGIFSSEVRSCSEEVLAAAVGVSGLLSVVPAVGAGAAAAAAGLLLGLVFSVAEGSVGLVVGGETMGAAWGQLRGLRGEKTCTYLLLLWPRLLLRRS